MADLNANGWRMAANGRACGAKSSKLTTSTQPTQIQKLQCHLDYIQDSVNKMSGASAGPGAGAGNANSNANSNGNSNANSNANSNGNASPTDDSAEGMFNGGSPITDEEKSKILDTVFSGKQNDMDNWEIRKSNPNLYIIFKKISDNTYAADPYENNNFYYIEGDKIIKATNNTGGRRRNRKRKTSKRKSSKKTHNKKAKSSKRR